MNKIVIFGSTGVTGLCATEAAIKKGKHVRAFVRDPSKLPSTLQEQLEIFKGDVLNYEDVYKAIQNTQAVVVVLGTRNSLKPTTDMSDGLKNIIKAMNELNIEIVSVCLSAFLFPQFAGDKLPPTYRDITADHQRMLDALKESNLKFIAILPPHIADKPESEYKVENNQYLGKVVSKHDLGNFLIESLEKPEHYRQICGIVSI
ncbi:flavin reductase (NADPH) [Rhynchophorus ferrugineus]|uniref:flavin reductase (NADPH) n=1 Tax=Rhynchophorus ferrugineus TaxID=354439 RepID=UPI003FCE9BE3